MAKMINTEAEQSTIQAALLAASMNFHDVVVYEDGQLKKAEFIQGSMHLTFTKTLKEGAKKFITKPYNVEDVLKNIGDMVE
jgi:hypothetical protein